MQQTSSFHLLLLALFSLNSSKDCNTVFKESAEKHHGTAFVQNYRPDSCVRNAVLLAQLIATQARLITLRHILYFVAQSRAALPGSPSHIETNPSCRAESVSKPVSPGMTDEKKGLQHPGLRTVSGTCYPVYILHGINEDWNLAFARFWISEFESIASEPPWLSH